MTTDHRGGALMPRPESPTVRRIMLGIRLRALRTRAGITADDAARHIARTDSTISRMETGQTSVPARVLERLVELYGATPDETAQLRSEERRGGEGDESGGASVCTKNHRQA